MESYAHAFLNPLSPTLHNVVSFVPRFLVAVILFALFYGLASMA